MTVTNAGTYKFTFSVTGVPANTFALYADALPIPGAIYSTTAGQNTGSVIVALPAGTIITLRNLTGAQVTFNPLLPGAVNASVTVERVA